MLFLFLPSWHKQCEASFWKNTFSNFSCLMTAQTLFSWAIFGNLILCFFFFSVFFLLQRKSQNHKCNVLFQNHFVTSWQSWQIQYLCTNGHYLWFQPYPQNTTKLGKAVKTSWTKFNTTLGPIFNTKTPKSWTSFNSTAYIYIYMCVCVCAARCLLEEESGPQKRGAFDTFPVLLCTLIFEPVFLGNCFISILGSYSFCAQAFC